MDQAETIRFDELYQRHLRLLKLQGKSQKTIDAYSRAVRRITAHFDCCPDQLTLEQREKYFSDLVVSHSWSTVKIDRNGLQFFWKHVLQRDWEWVNIVKAPKIRSLPDTRGLDDDTSGVVPRRVQAVVGHSRLWFLGKLCTVPYRNNPDDLSFDSIEEPIWRDDHCPVG